MKFKVKWGDIQNEFTKKVMVSNPGEQTPIKFYFETELSLLVFFHSRGITQWAEIPKETEGFNQGEIIADARELVEDPRIKRLNAVII